MMRSHWVAKVVYLSMCIFFLIATKPGWGQEPLLIVNDLNFDACDSIRFQANIAAVNQGRGTLTVAEREIRLLDVGTGDSRMVTTLLGLDGKPEKLQTFKTRQLVLVEGFLHPDGFVAALRIQKIKAVTENPGTLHQINRPHAAESNANRQKQKGK